MEDFISIIIFISVLQFMLLNGKSYDLKCPSNISWKIRATFKCNSTLKYYCLYNNVEEKYFEGCTGPDWDRKGSKRIFSGSFTRADCKHKRFQPFIFWTNGSLSDCVFAKSKCNEEGQLINKDESANDDRTCRCDYENNYTFIKTPRNICFCIPTREDCACYHTTYSTNSSISADNGCTQSGNKENKNRTDIIIYDKSLDGKTEKEQILLQPATSNFNMFKWKYETEYTLLVCLCFVTILVAEGFFIAVLFHKWTSDKIQSIKRYFRRNNTAGGQRLKEEGHQEIESSKLTTDEVNFLRMVHLLVRVVCPVVRLFFNNEIKPNQLRKTLGKKKQKMVKRYRKKKIINDSQWNLLFGPDIGKTLKSEDFDIRLMIYLLQTLANIKVCDLYPLSTDTSTSAMLARIKYIRNETTQNSNGKLTEDQFNKYWDDIGQAVLKLASSHTFAVENDQEDMRLIGRLLSISPININNRQLCTFIDIFEKYPAMILEQFISEYCMLNQVTIHDILREEKHRLYHKRLKTVSCCQCTTKLPIHSYSKCIPEKHWEALYTVTELDNSYYCKCELKPCIECFVPKRMITLDICVATTLILHIPNILKYFISRLCVTGFKNFLMNNKHTIYHCMTKNMCCECNNDSTRKILINEDEWNTLYIKEDAIYCKTGSEYCCCQYAVRNLIKYSDVDDTLLSKIFNVAGPLIVLNKVGQDTFFYFLNWTDDDQPLQGVLIELLNIIEDKQLVRTIRSSIISKSNETITNQFDARKWISKHLKQQQATTDHQCQILVRDEDGLKVKSIDIPEDFPLPHVTKKFNDITPEENNFLLVFYGLTNIVYPVLKKVFDTKCPDPVLHKIWMEFSQANKQTAAKNYSDDDNRKKKGIYLTESQKQQLFPENRKASLNINLQLMIHILKQISKEEEQTDDAHQLEAVENIRREIVQSSTGVLNETRFLDILKSLQKALLQFGEELYVEKILQLCHVKRILE